MTDDSKVAVYGWQALTAAAQSRAADWFDVDAWLGKRGHKYLSEGTRYWLAACGALAGTAPDRDRQGIVVGTNFGAHRTLTDLFHVARSEGSGALSPLSSPNFSINLVASHAALKTGARRFNLTLTTPQVAGLDALALAARELRQGRSDGVFAGAAEEGVRGAALLPPRLQGAVAASLALSGATTPGPALAQLSGFLEAHVPNADRWPAHAAIVASRIRRHLPSGWPAGARVYMACAAGAPQTALDTVAALLDAPSAPAWHELHDSHGCLEPLQALHDAMLGSVPSLFLYANQRGAFRALLVEPTLES